MLLKRNVESLTRQVTTGLVGQGSNTHLSGGYSLCQSLDAPSLYTVVWSQEVISKCMLWLDGFRYRILHGYGTRQHIPV